MLKMLRKLSVVAGASFLISGCYQLQAPVLEKGEGVALAGRFICTADHNGSKTELNIEENKDGFLSPDYTYLVITAKSPAPLQVKLSRLGKDLYLAQVSVKNMNASLWNMAKYSDYGAIYVRVRKSEFDIVMPNPGNSRQDESSKELAARHNVKRTPFYAKDFQAYEVTGDKKAVLAFLKDNTMNGLLTAASCRPAN